MRYFATPWRYWSSRLKYSPDQERIWRWKADGVDARAIVKFELLADLDDAPAGADVAFDGCDHLGAANLRGTGFASRHIEIRTLTARVGGVEQTAEINVTGLAGFLLAKSAAARSRRKPKDWYDIAFVLLHNDAGGPEDAAQAVLTRFAGDLVTVQSALDDLLENFAATNAQGPEAYAEQMMLDHRDVNHSSLLAEAVIAVETFHRLLYPD